MMVFQNFYLGEDKKGAIRFLVDALNFLIEHAGPPKLNYIDGIENYRFDLIYIMDILNKIRYMNKIYESNSLF